MSIRVYALSSELDVPSKVLLEMCKDEGISVISHSSTLTDNEAERLRGKIRSKQQAAAPAATSPQAAPAPLPTREEASKLAFAPTLGARRRRPPQQGVKVVGHGEHEHEPAAAAAVVEAPAAAPAVAAPAAEPAAVAPAAVEEPVSPQGVVETPAAAPASPAVAETALQEPPVAAEAAVPAVEAERPGRPERKVVSIDEFVIAVPKAIGRIEGIVPKEIPPRGGERKKPKGKGVDKEKKGPKKKDEPAAHPQAMGMTPDQLSKATNKAKELAHRTVSEAGRRAPGQSGIVADTNRPQSGRSATAGRRHAKLPDAEAAEAEVRKAARPSKPGSRGRRDDRVEVDTNIGILGAGHVRLERGEEVRRPFGEQRRRHRTGKTTKRADQPVVEGPVDIEEPITIKSFCNALGVQSSAVISRLMRRGMMVTVNESLTTELAMELALEFGVELNVKAQADVEDAIQTTIQNLNTEHGEGVRVLRAPVVVFMGHVDHGKTSLMDRIRSTHVVDGESGGITQHIGAYRVDFGERAVTFLDTPGHKAFTAMRARGAEITDIAVLVVAADDGVMPQTDEAINHARAAGVPIVVAMNKIDLPGANVQRLLGQLAERDLVAEEWGGKTMVVKTSAVTGEGVPELLEGLALEAELLELAADPTAPARGAVIEAEMREGLGTVMTLLVQEGTLRVGQVVLAGSAYGRVRAMVDDKGRAVTEAGPSMPVSVSGLSSVPNAGDKFYVFESLSEARDYAEEREQKAREKALATQRHVTLEDLFQQIEAQKVKQLNVILKADVQGSVGVLKSALAELKHPEVEVAVLHAAVGGINESDILLADASNAVVIGFHVIADEGARALAEQKGVDVRLYSIIYQITDDLRKALEGMLTPETREQAVGHLVVRQTFKVSRLGTVAGCYVTDGVIRRGNKVRISRQGIVMYEGQLESLKRFKDDAREITAGLECGLKVKGFDDIKIDDVLESLETVEVKRTF